MMKNDDFYFLLWHVFNRFDKEQEAKRLLSSLELKTAQSSIQLVGGIFCRTYIKCFKYILI